MSDTGHSKASSLWCCVHVSKPCLISIHDIQTQLALLLGLAGASVFACIRSCQAEVPGWTSTNLEVSAVSPVDMLWMCHCTHQNRVQQVDISRRKELSPKEAVSHR